MVSLPIGIPIFLAFLISLSMGLLFLISRVSELPLPHDFIGSSAGPAKGLVIILSGARGWTRFNQKLGDIFSANGFDVIGFDSLRYFFLKRKTPEILSVDLSRMMEAWLRQSPKSQNVVLIGYSKGADVLPFAVNRLPDDLKSRIRLVSLLGVARLASFKIRFSDLPSGRPGPFPVQVSPEIRKLEGMQGLCIYGDGDRVSLCRNLKRISTMEIREIKSGPVFHDAELISKIILEKLNANFLQDHRQADPTQEQHI